ncbi:hypothetical protein K1719_040278 [Acacia pycnantha]|nr:hypothetical protein K1719_040278 [Acacia pycnantha]
MDDQERVDPSVTVLNPGFGDESNPRDVKISLVKIIRNLLRRTSTTNLDSSSHLAADNKGCPSSLEAFEVD